MRKIFISVGVIGAMGMAFLAVLNSQRAYSPTVSQASTSSAQLAASTASDTVSTSTQTEHATLAQTNTPAVSATGTSPASSAHGEEQKRLYEFIAQGAGTVLEAMSEYAATHHFEYKTKEYPSLGLYVESINGVEATDGYYWILYINWKDSAKGASTAHVEKGDAIEWKYEKSY